ncbi:MAG: hypothetical protein K2I29_01285 [Clostridia bacterium]|nr:hypothetical protein [Clostridia bacterium]
MDFLQFIKEFVEGEISVEEFQNEVINNEGLQKFFDENIKTLPKFIKDRSSSLWVYIACLDAGVPGDRYDMHTIITQLF